MKLWKIVTENLSGDELQSLVANDTVTGAVIDYVKDVLQ